MKSNWEEDFINQGFSFAWVFPLGFEVLPKGFLVFLFLAALFGFSCSASYSSSSSVPSSSATLTSSSSASSIWAWKLWATSLSIFLWSSYMLLKSASLILVAITSRLLGFSSPENSKEPWMKSLKGSPALICFMKLLAATSIWLLLSRGKISLSPIRTWRITTAKAQISL